MTSGIVYSAVAKGSVILTSNELSLGEFEFQTKSFLPSVPTEQNTKTCFQSGLYSYHVLVQDMLTFICVAETDFGRTIPYTFLNEIQKKFCSGSLAVRSWNAMEHEFDREFDHVLKDQMIKFSSQDSGDNVGRVRGQVSEVIQVMNANIEKVVERGEKLDVLVDKTNELEVSSSQFRSTSKKVRRKMMCKNVKMWIIIISILLIIITVIVLAATNVIPLRSQS